MSTKRGREDSDDEDKCAGVCHDSFARRLVRLSACCLLEDDEEDDAKEEDEEREAVADKGALAFDLDD